MVQSILDAIGNTPMVEIKKLNPNRAVKLLAKLECFNPGGSVKDRAALYKIEAYCPEIFEKERLDQKINIADEDPSKIVDGFRSIDTILNLFNFFDDYADPEVQRLLSQRDKAHSEKNWELADKIREGLRSCGIMVQDHS